MHCIINQHVLKVYLACIIYQLVLQVYLACIVSLLGEAQAGLLYRSLYLGSLLAPGVRAADLNIEFSKIPRRNVFYWYLVLTDFD